MMRNQELVVENQALRLRIEELKNGFEGSCMACEPVGEMNKKLRDERDEARRELCRRQRRSVVFDDALAEANRRGWDCFKEDGK
jgi:hypothetical protein